MRTSVRNINLAEGAVGPLLVRLTIPMIGGMFAMSSFHLADTWFVSRLGVAELAAMTFTFPVVMVVGSVAMGLGIGISSLVSRALGNGRHERVKRLCTDGFLLSLSTVILLALIGLLTVNPLFRMLGATDDEIHLIRQYMVTYYSWVGVLIVPMVGNGIIRATGDTFWPAVTMVVSAFLNIVFDAWLIFGGLGVPPLGLKGAALASALSRAIGMLITFWVLGSRNLFTLHWPGLRTVAGSWAELLYIGVPSALTHMLMPLSGMVTTRLIAMYGVGAVAAWGAADRLMHFSFLIPIALGSALVPFAGQNWGAGRQDRILYGWNRANLFTLAYGAGSMMLAWPLGLPLARLFTHDPAVMRMIAGFLRITLTGSLLIHTAVQGGFLLNGIGMPLRGAMLSTFRLLALQVPLAIAGNRMLGLYGVFWGIAVAQLIAGSAAWAWISAILRSTGHSRLKAKIMGNLG